MHNDGLMSATLRPSCRSLAGLAAGLLVLAGLAATPHQAVQAAQADRSAPAVVESTSLDHDERSGVTIFEGNVVLTKGSLILRGNRLVLRQLDSGVFTAEVTGSPARVQQARDTPGEMIRGEGAQILYNSQDEQAILTGQAIMRRLSGSQLLDQLIGERLVYSSVTETYKVESAAGAGASASAPGRVQMTILPRTSAGGASAPAARP